MSTQVKQEVVGREFRFAYHIEAPSPEEPDFHFVKEQVHYKKEDGTVEIRPEMRLIKDLKRPVWFTRPNLRTHKEKREFEKEENLIKMEVRQSELKQTVARMTGSFRSFSSLRELCGSPYVYGADIPSTLILRKTHYEDLYPGLTSPRTVCTFDTETDMLEGKEDIIITTSCFKNQIFVGVQKRVLQGYANPMDMINGRIKKHMDAFIEKNQINPIFKKNQELMDMLLSKLDIKVYIGDSEIDVIKETFLWIHDKRPDFVAIWNINFDVPKVLTACENAGIDPRNILCDPKLPHAFRKCKYKEGATKKVTAAGKQMPIKPANQWHTLELTSSFYVIDSMCCYRRIRGGAELSSYSLESILNLELNIGKLKIDEAEKYKKGEWHRFMQKNMIFDYIAYALFDSFSMILLDLKTKDLSRTLPYLCDFTNFEDYASQTKRLRDNAFLFGLESLGMVLGSLGPKKKAEKKEVFVDEDAVIMDGDEGGIDEDDKTLDRRNWVVTLRAFMSVLGLCVIKEDPKLQTLIRAFVYDSDVVSSYPNCTLVANVSKRTTRKEVIRIGNIPEQVFRMQNLNCIFGLTNAVEYSQNMFGFPKFDDLDRMFKMDKMQGI